MTKGPGDPMYIALLLVNEYIKVLYGRLVNNSTCGQVN